MANPYGYNPMTGTNFPYPQRKEKDNWLTDPEAPWNTWAQNLEGYLQDWVKSQQAGLQAGLQQQNLQAGRQAIGQGLYTGTYTSSLPAENLARMVGQNTQQYAGAMAQLQGTGLSQLMQGQQIHGTQMLGATLENLMREMQAKAASYGWGDFLGDFMEMAGNMVSIGIG